jgi:single-stranded DNA-binding protein
MSIDITVTGRLTKDPELRKTQSGKLVTSFGLAHNFRERAGNQFNDVATVFFDASVWEEDGAAEVAELGLTKGTVSPSRASGPSGLGPPRMASSASMTY